LFAVFACFDIDVKAAFIPIINGTYVEWVFLSMDGRVMSNGVAHPDMIFPEIKTAFILKEQLFTLV